MERRRATMTAPQRTGAVAVFDVALPPGVAFLRSLGRLGVPVIAYSSLTHAAGRYSKYTTEFRTCPDVHHTDDFIAWLITEYQRGEFELVAPTSDFIAFVVAEVDERLGTDLAGGVGGTRAGAAVRDCLFKDCFSIALEQVGFPVPQWGAPTTTDEAIAEARRVGYPVVLKPRSHIGIGAARGVIADSDSQIEESFVPYQVEDNQTAASHRDPDLGIPIVQQMIDRPSLDCVSITGCLGRDGELLAASTSRKVDQWGTGLSIGTVFEVCERPAFFDHAIDAVQRVLGTGIFEFEVLTDLDSGEYWGIDLNPRAYGQIALDIGRGNDLPALWFGSATGRDLTPAPAWHRPPTHWRMGTPYYAGAVVRTLRGPGRVAHAMSVITALRQPTAGSMHSWSDLRPGIALGLWILRHPGGLVRPYLRE
jgi:predicted ATP-grasp superfamily ATP-dependent carboligase